MTKIKNVMVNEQLLKELYEDRSNLKQAKQELINCMVRRVKEAEENKEYLEEEVCLSEWKEAVQEEIQLIEKHTGKKIEEIIK